MSFAKVTQSLLVILVAAAVVGGVTLNSQVASIATSVNFLVEMSKERKKDVDRRLDGLDSQLRVIERSRP